MQRFLLLAAILMAQTVFAAPVDLYLSEGRIFYKAPTDTVWSIKDGHITVNPGDTLKSTGADKVILSAGDGLRFILSNETYVLFNKENMIKAELIKGQVLFDRTDNTPFLVTAKWCEFKPEGTAAAVKINKKGHASVAVLRGNVNMKAPSGVEQTVPAGSFSSYDASTSSFSPVKPLPESARTSLESYSGITVDAPLASNDNEDENATDEISSTPSTQSKTDVVSAAAVNESGETEKSTESADKRSEDNGEQNNDEKDIASTKNDEKKDSGEKSGSTSVGSTPSTDVASKDVDEKKEEVKGDKTSGEETGETGKEGDKEGPGHKPVWEISAGMVTIDDEQWTRIAVAVDVPVWRFGVCFDLEMFLDSKGSFSKRGWDFSDGRSAGQSLLRKIRYIRFNKENDPVFIKVGGLENVSYNYGFVVNNFTNMLDYPGEKLFGVQFDINDVSPIGLTLRTMIPDVMDFGNDGGMIFNQLGFRPLKALDKKILSGIKISGIFAADFNQYAPARDWDYTLEGTDMDLDEDGINDLGWWQKTAPLVSANGDTLTEADIAAGVANGVIDTLIEHQDKWASRAKDKFMMLGGDIIIPILTGKVIGLDLYGQAALAFAGDDDSVDKTFKGWGIGAPGAFAKLGPVKAQIEYRHARDQFEPGYFNTYYLKERITRNPIIVKESTLSKEHKNGVFGKIGFNIKDFLVLEGAYQYMKGDGYKVDPTSDNPLDSIENVDQRFNATAYVGDVLLSKIPKVNKVEFFYDQTDIYGNIFKKSLNTYWGHRIGVEVVKGAGIIWETRYGWRYEDGDLVDDKQVRLAAALTF